MKNRHHWWICWVALLLMVLPAPAQERLFKQTQGKYLFLVEASSNMVNRAEMSALALADMVERGLGGRMQEGDIFSVIPFNESVNTANGFNQQTWHASQNRHIGNLTFLFLKKFKHEKRADFSQLSSFVQQVAQQEKNINIYIISSGTHNLENLPFADDINTYYEMYRKQSRKTKSLCVTALVYVNEQLNDWAVGSVEPPLPARTLGRKPETTPVPAPAEAEKKTNQAPVTPIKTIVATNPLPPRVEVKSPVTETSIPPSTKTNQQVNVAPPPKNISSPPAVKPATNAPAQVPSVSPSLPNTNGQTVIPPVVVKTNPPQIKPIVKTNTLPAFESNTTAKVTSPTNSLTATAVTPTNVVKATPPVKTIAKPALEQKTSSNIPPLLSYTLTNIPQVTLALPRSAYASETTETKAAPGPTVTNQMTNMTRPVKVVASSQQKAASELSPTNTVISSASSHLTNLQAIATQKVATVKPISAASPISAPVPLQQLGVGGLKRTERPWGMILAGCGFLIIAVALTLVWHRSNRPKTSSSLITQSMGNDSGNPRRLK